MSKLRKNVVTVLRRLSNSVENDMDDESVDCLAESLDEFLDSLKNDDFFGTEAQSDPRGDGRNSNWTINKIQKD